MTSAILFALLCNLLYAVGYALAKLLSGSLDPLEITFLRSALVLVAAMGVTGARPGTGAAWRHALAPPRAWDQRLAALALIASTTISVFGYALLPVTEASALGFTGPIILTACGALLLRERVDGRRWAALGCGFAGMVVMLRPGGGLFAVTSLVPVAAALAYALYQVLVRRLRGVASANDALVQGALCGTLLLALPALVAWRMPSVPVLALVVVFTAVQTAALAALAAAVRRAEVSAIAPWHYSRLVFALAMDALLFGRVPPVEALAGAALIAAGGLVLLRRPG
ncbi:EamA family transporter [Dankookia rubra]|uniref:EamA family transporter n=1 Tax=Dankookia rubra TaxID=1442381 RepID=A0A4V3A9M6_9PROT|nr:DMT family transporter [Dankookia rubra]TDH59815.1 EamA family transporter [Dankookia rubra]